MLVAALFVASVLVGLAGIATGVYLSRSPNGEAGAIDSLPRRVVFRIAAALTFGIGLLVLLMLLYVVYVMTTDGFGR